MTVAELCDVCGQEPGQYALTDRDTGMTQFVGPNCLALLGFTMQLQADQPVVDKLLADAGYAVTKREKERRKALLEPEFDAGRTIVEVVETAPRDDRDEAADDDDDMPTGQHADKSTNLELAERGQEAIDNLVSALGDGPTEPRPDSDDPAPY